MPKETGTQGGPAIAGIRAALALSLVVLGLSGARADPDEIQAGRRIALGFSDAPECASCHGRLGQGGRATGPRLAAQSDFYLRKQLDDFASGARRSAVMGPIAKELDDEQRQAVAAYYAAIDDAPYPPPPEGDRLLLQRGGALSAAGAPARGIPPCRDCHADAGTGIPPSYPYLAGQFADYTAGELLAWQRGDRRNDPLDVMAQVAKALTAEDIRALALYFARLRASPDEINDLTPAQTRP